MLHIIPILCLILFIGLTEIRLQEHLKLVELRVKYLEEQLEDKEIEDLI